ncbi:MAG: beta-ketoacyl-[acyl-carrier-protein] synthase family protein [Bacteriovoracia bacterium]
MKRIAVTGMGVVSPNGIGCEAFYQALQKGESGIKRITRFDPSGYQTQIAGEVDDSAIVLDQRDVKMSFAILAAREAMAMAQLNGHYAPKKCALSLGLGLELFHVPDLIDWQKNRYPAVTDEDKFAFLNYPAERVVHLISHEFSLHSPPRLHLSACVASTDAIGTALELLRSGEVDVVVAGGTDSMVNPMGLGGFCLLGALSARNDEPTKASRPFDKNRDGFVLGEGAAFMVLEREENAKKRGADIQGFILGHGHSMDAYSPSDPHPDGEGALRAMKHALADARITANDISAVNAHGTSTPKNDVMETKAIQTLLGVRAMSVPVFATKSMTGHLIAAGGALETVGALLCMKQQSLHPTINTTEIDPSCQLDHVLGQPRKGHFSIVLKNSFAFGGHNSCLILGSAE